MKDHQLRIVKGGSNEAPQRVLITGGAGYLGSVMARRFLDSGYAVRVVDLLWFGGDGVEPLEKNPSFELVNADICDASGRPEILEGVDAIVHLAGFANGPSRDIDTSLAKRISREGTIALAKAAAAAGIKRFVFASSCSVYGGAGDKQVTEASDAKPLTHYAKELLETEKALLKLREKGLEPVVLRLASLYGISPRMRFDLPLNMMTMHAVKRGKMFVLQGGSQWRPFLHVNDATEAFRLTVKASPTYVAGKVLNVGSDRDVIQIRELATKIRTNLPMSVAEDLPEDPDRRSYKVSFRRIREAIGFTPMRTVEDGIREIAGALKGGQFKQPENLRYFNFNWLNKTLALPAREGGTPVRQETLRFTSLKIGKPEEREAAEALRSAGASPNKKVAELESAMCKYTGALETVAVNSSMAALHLSLIGLGVRPGDEVVTSPMTSPATVNTIVHMGARPVFVDIESSSLNLDPSKLTGLINTRTRAIVVTHTAGNPVNMETVWRIASRARVQVVEDASAALGARLGKDKKIGADSRSAACCFSFDPTAHMGLVGGGAIVTHDVGLATRLRMLAQHGLTTEAWGGKSANDASAGLAVVIAPGFQYAMTDLQAAVATQQLKRQTTLISKRRKLADQYDSLLADAPHIRPTLRPEASHAAHTHYIVRLDIGELAVNRNDIIEALAAEGVESVSQYFPLHLHPYYADKLPVGTRTLPTATRVASGMISLPLHAAMAATDCEDVVRALKKVVRHYRRKATMSYTKIMPPRHTRALPPPIPVDQQKKAA